jgi:general secretion pathway protein G
MKRNKGFTLIELLVVIAIIGILSSVVLASLNVARSKGKDASLKESVSSVRAQAEIYYNGTGGNSYTGACSDANIKKLIIAAQQQVGSSNSTAIDTTYAGCVIGGSPSGTSYTAWTKLNDAAQGYFCVDASGFAGTTTSASVTTGGNAIAGTSCQ